MPVVSDGTHSTLVFNSYKAAMPVECSLYQIRELVVSYPRIIVIEIVTPIAFAIPQAPSMGGFVVNGHTAKASNK